MKDVAFKKMSGNTVFVNGTLYKIMRGIRNVEVLSDCDMFIFEDWRDICSNVFSVDMVDVVNSRGKQRVWYCHVESNTARTLYEVIRWDVGGLPESEVVTIKDIEFGMMRADVPKELYDVMVVLRQISDEGAGDEKYSI